MSNRHLPVLPPLPDAPPAAEHAPLATVLTPAEREALLAVAGAAIPAGRRFPAAGAAAVGRLEEFLRTVPQGARDGYRALLRAVSAEARMRYGASPSALPTAALLDLLQRWQDGGFLRRLLLRGLLTPIKVAHFDDPVLFEAVGCRYRAPPAVSDLPRYVRERTLEAAELPDGEVLACDAVIVGSGAGGAVAAKELAEAGCAVVLLEEGAYLTRADFTGRTIEMQRKLYRDMGATVALGNTAIPVPIGRSVGGTTTINSGTCYRMPPRVLRKWREQLGLTALTEAELDACYGRVEEVLGVEEARAIYLGGTARVVARGADALGYRHGPLRRNAPGCDGQGVCCFGCPTDAKRSTNVSYVPLALRAGAQLVTGARVLGLLIEGGRVVGVQVRAQNGRRFTVRARATLLACGALLTPVLLQEDRVARLALGRSGQLGRNLSIHPAAAAYAVMPEEVRSYAAIPQGYAIEEFHDEGLLFEGVSAPLDLGAASLTSFGPRFTELMEAYERFVAFGFLVEEQSRGRVRPGAAGRPLITYYLQDVDVARIKQGLEVLGRLFLRAGAETVLLQVPGFEEVRSEEDLRRFRRAHIRARDLDLTAYHPLGTARMGPDPRTSVVGPDGQAHDLPGLYLCDGSVLPSSPAVNPQLTIMALSTWISRRLAGRL